MTTLEVTVTFAPMFGPGAYTEVKRMPAVEFPRVARLLHTHGYGTPFMHETGEYVVAVAAAVFADGQASDQECVGTAFVSKAERRRLGRLPELLA